jgi:hypothetical protein
MAGALSDVAAAPAIAAPATVNSCLRVIRMLFPVIS